MYGVYIVFAVCLLHLGCGQLLNGTGEKSCAGFNEYCQTNSDCCSRNCLTFSYKCIRERVQQPELQVVDEITYNTPTAQSIQELVDRFGGDGSSISAASPSSNTGQGLNRPSGNGFQTCKSQGSNCLTSYQCCSGQCSAITNICISRSPEYFQVNTFSQPQPTCAKHGDSCRVDSDCCSSNCLKFSYRCIRDRANQADIQIVGNSNSQLADRFGADGSIPLSTSGPCRMLGDNCLTSNQCCTAECSKITNKCISGPEHFTYFPNQAQSTPPSCYSIGDKCLRQEDCCSPLRCHDYWHHCVT